ncbi:MAG: hypothetical protein GC161_06620 [Planctomycetaceae bacterium]|nr:hypothetical protein [Planctomycetaceae bacterium]
MWRSRRKAYRPQSGASWSALRERFPGVFSVEACQRGLLYWQQGRVEEIRLSETGVSGRVRGSRRYRTECLLYDGGGLLTVCDCEAHDTWGPCKHAFALLLEADERGMLPAGSSSPATSADPVPAPGAAARTAEQARALHARLERLQGSEPSPPAPALEALVGGRLEVAFALDEMALDISGELRFRALRRRVKRDGSPGPWQNLSEVEERQVREPIDVAILARLKADERRDETWNRFSTGAETRWRSLDEANAAMVLPLLARAKFLFRSVEDQRVRPLRLRLDGWRFEARLERSDGGARLVGEAVCTSVGESAEPTGDGDASLVEEERRPLASPLGGEAAPWRADYAVPRRALHAGSPDEDSRGGPLRVGRAGWLLYDAELGRLDWGSARELALDLICSGPIEIPAAELESAVAKLAPIAGERLVGELVPKATLERPAARLRVGTAPRVYYGQSERHPCGLHFLYGDEAIAAHRSGQWIARGNQLVARDLEFERSAGERLAALGLKPDDSHRAEHHAWVLARDVAPVLETLVAEGWRVEFEGRAISAAVGSNARLTTGIDWFDVHGEVDYGGETVALPQILAAAKRKERWISLADGRLGLLPTDWQERWGWLKLGQVGDAGDVRFPRQQAWLLDALLAQRSDVGFDAAFQKQQKALRSFDTARSVGAPRAFAGELRPYQAEGLGWLDALSGLGFGGCLADDMGLGKTVQVLAHLERRRAARVRKKAEHVPSLVVAPRSVLFNWIDEARRFAPKLKVAEHHGSQRWQSSEGFERADLVVTTYATMRLDIERLQTQPFDVVVLDEAQAIKNAGSQVAKAARLLRAEQRLALTGTPVENRLEDLWSLFEFLNPGMLGGANGFAQLLGAGNRSREDNLVAIARAIRPFFLRRTKAKVLAELPEKTEQTVYVELPPQQRKAYDQLAKYYKKLLLGGEVKGEELGANKLEVLTALLRLRQCACHEGLIDEERNEAPSAKLEELLARLEEIQREGNKALVFSQFTSFLALVRARLDAAGIPHEYLDGQTRDRRARVERFQADPKLPVFLVSLKAGGTGLNLTAADYVFLLDPWWNPAVESQAIDRAHRLGRTGAVLAYRIVAKDTIEERVLDLQAQKRELVEGLFDDRSSSIANLRRADLERLLS